MGVFGLKAADYLHIRTADGWTVINLDNADRMTFNGGSMKVSDASGNIVGTFPQSALQEISVNDEPGASSVTSLKAGQAPFRFSAGTRSAEMLADGMFEIFSMDGKRLVAIPARTGDRIALDAMSGAGVVIVKSGSYTIKAVL